MTLDQELFLLLELLRHRDWDLERVSNNIRRSESKPLRERDIGHAIGLVDLNPDKVFCRRSILDVVTLSCQSCLSYMRK